MQKNIFVADGYFAKSIILGSSLIEDIINLFVPKKIFTPKHIFNGNKELPDQNPKKWFKTSDFGGISLNVLNLYNDNIRHYDVDIKCEYLKNLTISPNIRTNITGKIILISNFGVVDGHDQYLRENNKNKKPILLYEFKDAYDYFYDAGDDDHYRLQKIMKLNLPKYEPILCG